MPIIQCNEAVANIPGFRYGGNPLNIEAFAGEIINIIGPDYSGKSAWTRMLCGVERCFSGEMRIFDKPLRSYTRPDWINLRKNVAFLKEDTALLSAANALQNVLVPAIYHNIDTPANILNQANSLLKEITPDSNPKVLPAQLRSDQRYKIAIARALILRPKAIILDNPFALLDKAATEHLKKFLLKHSKNNNTLIIIVTHDVKFALEHSDKIIFISKDNIKLFDEERDITTSEDSQITEFLKNNL